VLVSAQLTGLMWLSSENVEEEKLMKHLPISETPKYFQYINMNDNTTKKAEES
jgi:hypothetical protein